MKRTAAALLALGLPLFSSTNAGAAGPEDVVLGTRVHVMPMRSADAPTPATLTATQLAYYGGRVISNVKVVQVLWGPNVDATVKAQMPDFYKAVTASAYFDWLGEYNTVGKSGAAGGGGSNQRIGRGSFGSQVTITPGVAGARITDDQIQSELARQIGAGTLPAPETDAAGNVNTIYMFDFPPGMTITGPGGAGTSCVQFCAYHGTISLGGKSVPYGVHPDLGGNCQGGCGMDPNNFNNATSVHSHELIEAVTDAEVGLGGNSLGPPLAWYDSAANTGEIGDICNGQQAKLGNYVVQTEWSNAAGACITSRTLPVCNGTNDPCRPCNATDNGQACTGGTPACATDPKDPKVGTCVQCTANAQCSGATPVCDKGTDTCRACTSNADCTSDVPVCVTTGGANHGKCVQCVSSTDCANGGKCDTTTNVCQAAAPAGGGTGTPGTPGAPGAGNPSNPGQPGSGGYYRFPNTNQGCSMASGEAPYGLGGLAAVGLAIAGAVRRRRRDARS